MSREVSIAVCATDRVSSTILTIRNSFQAFNKNMEDTQERLDELNKTKASLKVDMNNAKRNIKEAQKALNAATEGTEEFQKALERLEKAFSDHNRMADNLKAVSDEAKNAFKALQELDQGSRKLENRAETGSGDGSGILKSLASSGATAMLGNVISNAANTFVSNALGREVGNYFSSVLSYGASGAAIGSMIAPGIGTAVGGLIGGVVGMFDGAMKNYENENAARSEYVQNQYSEITGARDSSLQRGIGIAAQREQNQISFSTLLGSEDNAKGFLSELVDFAYVTPFDYDTLTDISKTLLAYGYKQEEILPLLSKIGDTGATLGMSKEDMNALAKALGRMEVSGKATLEYLNPLLERGIPVWDYLAEAGGRTKEEVIQMVSKGLVPGSEAAEALADYMGAANAGGMKLQSGTYSGLLSTLEDAQAELDSAMGRGYEDTRKPELQRQIDYFESEGGEIEKQANYLMGTWQASLDNKKDELQRGAKEALFTGIIPDSFEGTDSEERLKELMSDFAALAQDDSVEAGEKMGALLAEAQALAINEYNASEGMTLYKDSQIALVGQLRENAKINDAYWDFGLQMSNAFMGGFRNGTENGMAGIKDYLTNNSAVNPDKFIVTDEDGKQHAPIAFGLNRVPYDDYPALLHEGERVLTAREARNYDSLEGEYGLGFRGLNGIATPREDPFQNLPGFAYGLDRVPYDNFPALLHEGERVLTANEAKSHGNSLPNVTINVYGLTVREEADVDKIARSFAEQLRQAFILAV